MVGTVGTATRPDIILLILDTQRLDRLSCYGYQHETSHYLDRLAAESQIYRQAISPAQWTVPSHASMFTGLYPSGHGMFHASSVLPEHLTTLAERLGANGYFTAAYCNNPLLGVVNNGLRRGFHCFLNYGGFMTSRPNRAGIDAHLFDRYRQNFKRLLSTALTGMQDSFARSNTLLDLSFSPLMVPFWQTALRFKGNTRKTLQDAAQQLIERKGLQEDQPVFSFINLMGTHMPYHPPERFSKRFAAGVLREKSARRYLRRFNSDVFGWLAPLANGLDKEQKVVLDGMYDAEVAYQDELVGGFIEQLRVSGKLDRSLLIVCADHGEHLGEKQLMGHSISLYNELVHVPLIIRDPEGIFPRGASVEHVVSTRRIFHTILTAARLADAQEERFSLAQSDQHDPEYSMVFAEGVTPQNALSLLRRHRSDLVEEYALEQPRYAAWDERYKLVQRGENHLELYNIFDDPGEQTNLRDSYPERVSSMKVALQAYVQHQEPVEPALLNDDFDEDPEVYRRLRDLGYIE